MKLDLIIAIKEAYKKIYADKIKAKKLIKELNDLKLHFSYTSQVICKMQSFQSKNHHMFVNHLHDMLHQIHAVINQASFVYNLYVV